MSPISVIVDMMTIIWKIRNKSTVLDLEERYFLDSRITKYVAITV